MKRFFWLLFLVSVSGVIYPARAGTRYLVTQSTYSDCGPAALATLLHFYLGVSATEQEMIRLAEANPTTGTTLMGLEAAAKAKGCDADSFRMDFPTLRQQLAAFPTPVMVRTQNPEPHFSLVLAIDDGYVYLADPAAGNIVLSRNAFLRRWLIAPEAGAASTDSAQEGYVFLAAGPDTPEAKIGQKRQMEIIRGLARQLRSLQTARSPRNFFRR